MTQGHSRERLVEAVADHEYSPWGSHWCSCGWSPDAPSYGMAREHAHHVLDALLSLTDDSGVPEVVNVLPKPEVGHCDRCGTLCALCSGHRVRDVRLPPFGDQSATQEGD